MTSSRKRQNLRSSLVFPDKVRVVVFAPIEGMDRRGFRDYRAEVDSEGVLVAERGYHHNLFLRSQSSGRTRVSGSMRRWADAEGVIPLSRPFGTEECSAAFCALDEFCGWPPGTTANGRLTGLEYTADLLVPSAREIIRSARGLPRTTPFTFGDSNLHLYTKRHSLVLYGKLRELIEKGRSVPYTPEDLERGDILRIEDRRRDVPEYLADFKDESGVVRAGTLADLTCRDALALRWAERARRLEFRQVLRYAEPARKGYERILRLALERIEELGGVDVVLDQIRAEHDTGLIDNERSQIRAIERLAANPRLTATSTVAADFAAAIDDLVSHAA